MSAVDDAGDTINVEDLKRRAEILVDDIMYTIVGPSPPTTKAEAAGEERGLLATAN